MAEWKKTISRQMTILVALLGAGSATAGPYTEAGINGYIDMRSWRHANPLDPNAVLNPIFAGWATHVVDYSPADRNWSGAGVWNDPNRALGPTTGQNFDIVSLGELDTRELAQGAPPGHITLAFGDPCGPASSVIRNGKGYDFVIFENGFVSDFTTGMGSFAAQMLAELASVEVSSNGRDFARFPSVSLTPERVGPYGTIEVSNVHNLAGKHPNAGGVCTGTPFDLNDLADHPDVVSGRVDLNDIRYVRLVDVPGNGSFQDDATACTDPDTWPQWAPYDANHPIYDFWPSWGSGGFDLEALGVLREQQFAADVNLDGKIDGLDLLLFASAWQSHFGQENWNARCDLFSRKDLVVNGFDFAAFAAQWRRVESWRATFKGR